MRQSRNLSENLCSGLRSCVFRVSQWTSCFAAIVCGLLLVQASLADDKQTTTTPKTAVNSSDQPTIVVKPGDLKKDDRRVTDDNSRPRGALGVLLGESRDGAGVVRVIPGSPAERAGLQPGDEIRYVGGKRIHSAQELIDQIARRKPNTLVDVLIRRNGNLQGLGVYLATWDSTFGGDHSTKHEAGRASSPANGADQRVNPNNSPPSGAPEMVDQRLRQIEQRLLSLQQEINELRRTQFVNRAGAHNQVQTFNFDQWWERQHHGEADNDPALFQ